MRQSLTWALQLPRTSHGETPVSRRRVQSRSMTPLPYLTRDFPGIGGTIKNREEDFFVQEVPLYEPSGEGEHVYCEIQKVGLTTFEAVSRVARAMGVRSRDVGYAGMKDARAVTR